MFRYQMFLFRTGITVCSGGRGIGRLFCLVVRSSLLLRRQQIQFFKSDDSETQAFRRCSTAGRSTWILVFFSGKGRGIECKIQDCLPICPSGGKGCLRSHCFSLRLKGFSVVLSHETSPKLISLSRNQVFPDHTVLQDQLFSDCKSLGLPVLSGRESPDGRIMNALVFIVRILVDRYGIVRSGSIGLIGLIGIIRLIGISGLIGIIRFFLPHEI